MSFSPEAITAFETCDRDAVAVADLIPRVERESVHDMKFINEGKFGHVRLVRLFGGLQASEMSFAHDSFSHQPAKDDDEEESPEFFAAKYLNMDSVDPLDAAKQLAHEARILSGLDHENIIKLRGISSDNFAESFVDGSRGYFLLLDVLDGTLQDLLDQKRKEKRKSQKFLGKMAFKVRKKVSKRLTLKNNKATKVTSYEKRPSEITERKGMRRLSSLSTVGDGPQHQRSTFKQVLQRLSLTSSSSDHQKRDQQEMYIRVEETAAIGIARGLEYLHFKNIVFRDLKPANIGYYRNVGPDGSTTGWTVKLIDFGLAQVEDKCEIGKLCGSLGYISPEAMQGHKATVHSDVFSFGTLLAEICSLEVPYGKNRNPKRLNMEDFYDDMCKRVANGKLRPMDDLDLILPCFGIQALVQDCWESPKNRPTCTEIIDRLDAIVKPKGTACDWTQLCTEDGFTSTEEESDQ